MIARSAISGAILGDQHDPVAGHAAKLQQAFGQRRDLARGLVVADRLPASVALRPQERRVAALRHPVEEHRDQIGE
jgi:hypothetical protein